MSIFKKLFKKNKTNTPKDQFYSLEVKKVIRETPSAVSLVFEKPNSFEFKPGQYLTLKTTIEGVELRRAYSLSSQPHQSEMMVTVKETPDGYFSKYVNQEVKKGYVFEVLPPSGNFTFNADSSQARHIVGFAGGSGITPIFSILVNLLENEPESKFTLIFGNRTEKDIIFNDKLNQLNIVYGKQLNIIHVMSDIDDHDLSEFTGYIDQPIINRLNDNYFNFKEVDLFYLCGPGEMIQSIESSIKQLGISSNKIKKELFTVPIATTDSQELKGIIVNATIDFIYNGDKHTFNYNDKKKTVLDTALDNGMKAPFSCLNGVCSTCSARLEEGTVEMEQNFALEPEDVKAGYILTCQSRPTSGKLIINWDDNKA